MKKLFPLALLCFVASRLFAADMAQDSLLLKELVVNSPKEVLPTNQLGATNYNLSAAKIEKLQINSLKDISLYTPNFYIPDYGSKITSSVYVRGIGSRMNEPSIGLYVDNIPYLDKSGFDFDFFDIQAINVLLGPQATLYGRNTMAGVVNMYTLSPLNYQGTRFSASYSNYNDIKTKLSHYSKLNNKLGLSVAGYYNSNDGYFTNAFDGRTNKSESFGGRAKVEYQLTQKWQVALMGSYDHSQQNAYPYAAYDTLNQKAGQINYNEDGSYKRDLVSGGLSIQRKGNGLLFTSATGFQTFEDKMSIDQDFTADSIFVLTQNQKSTAWTQELVLRSDNKNNYQWVLGAFGFMKDLNISSPMTFRSGGIKMLQGYLDMAKAKSPGMPTMRITDKEMAIPGEFTTPSEGCALYHQSSYTFDEKLTLTTGLRLDYEKTSIDYNTEATQNIKMKFSPSPMAPFTQMPATTYVVSGSESQENWQLMPKFAMKYQINKTNHLFSSIAKGYKAGGYNYAMFSDILQSKMGGKKLPDIEKTISYKPEYSWNYEIGLHSHTCKDRIVSDLAIFKINDRDQQMATYTSNGSRVITNANKVESYGFEANVRAKVCKSLNLNVTYGYTHSTFKEYRDSLNKIDFTDKRVPFVPENTFSAGAEYSIFINKKILEKIVIGTQYNGAGRIYWNEANSLYQDFYGVLNGEISFIHKSCQITGWIKNALEENYNTFYFESMRKSFVQQGRPMTFGVTANYSF